jgi:polyferredoxin
MNMLRVRRIAQSFFFVLFLWFCVVATLGERWYQLRGWPINWFLQLDPLVALGTLLTTHRVYAGLLWGILTLALTMILGRFFCGWVCPFGALQQFTGWLGQLRAKHRARVTVNQYHPAQRLKYYLLVLLLGAAAGGLLQTGLLDPIPLMHRAVNFLLLPGFPTTSPGGRIYSGAWSIALVALVVLLSTIWVPRFYCRFICPLGALFGVLVRWTPWRLGKRNPGCRECELCETNCEGACEPFGKIRLAECLLCLNCIPSCRQGEMAFGPKRSAAGEVECPPLSRRGFFASAAAGLAIGPALRLGGAWQRDWDPGIVRPPGALPEEDFVGSCIKCGQCMRVCPTNVVQPALLQAGLEGLWTPILNFRAGSSGCQQNCVACGNVCPTAAIRPLSLDEKLGRGAFQQAGPIRMGTAFIDRGRCLPWAMDVPCIVCQENCPTSPKALYVREEFRELRDKSGTVQSATLTNLGFEGAPYPAGKFATGDYFVRLEAMPPNDRRLISENASNSLTIAPGSAWASPPAVGSRFVIEVRLQQPVVDADRCTGCGICQHECPVSGLRAIRVTAENETRNPGHSLTVKT